MASNENDWEDVDSNEWEDVPAAQVIPAQNNNDWEDVPEQTQPSAIQPQLQAQPQTQEQDDWETVDQPSAPSGEPSVVGNIKDYWTNKADRFKRQDKLGKGMEIGGTLLDTLANTIGKPGQAIKAGLLAKARGEGDFFGTAGSELLYGNQDKELTRGWEPTSLGGKFAKFGTELASDIVTDPFIAVGGLRNVLGKLGKAAGELDTVADLAKGVNTSKVVERNLGQTIAKAGHDVLRPVEEVLTSVQDKFNKPIQKVFETIGDTAKLGLKGIDRVDDIITGGKVSDLIERKVNDLLIPASKKVPEKIRSIFQGPKGNMNATGANIEQLGNYAKDKAFTLSPNNPEQAFDNVFRDIVNKNPNTPATQLYKNMVDEINRRLDSLEPEIKNALGFDLNDVRKGWDREYHVPRGTMKLKPYSQDKETITRIIGNLNNKMAEFQSAGNANAMEEAAALLDYYQSVLTGTNRKIFTPAYVGVIMNKNKKIGQFIKDLTNTSETSGLIKGDWLRGRVIPEELVSVFEPERTLPGLLDYWQGVNRDVTAMEMLTKYGADNPQAVKRLVAEQLPSDLAKDLSHLPKEQLEHMKAIQGELQQTINKELDNFIPQLPNVEMAAPIKEYMNETLGRFSPDVDDFLDKFGRPGEFWKEYTDLFKKIKLRDIAPVIRNQFEFLASGLPHGESIPQHFTNQKLYLDFIRGNLRSAPQEMRDVMGKVFGGNTGSIISELTKQAYEPDMLQKIFKGIKTKSGNNKLVSTMTNGFQRYMNEMAHQLAAPDMAVRMSLFENQLKKISGKGLIDGLKDKEAVNKALRFVDDNTIQYDSLPKVVQFIRNNGIQPFMAYMSQAPFRNAKAFMANPAKYLQIQSKAQAVSQRNLEKEGDEFRDVYDKRQNKLANLLSPFGGDIYLGPSGTSGQEFATLSTAPLNIFSTGQKFANYGKTGFEQGIDMIFDWAGFGGQTAPISPLGVVSNAQLAHEDPKAFARSLLLSNLPTGLVNVANIGVGTGMAMPIPGLQELGANLIGGGQRAPSLDQSILRFLGQKVKPNDLPSFMESKDKYLKQFDNAAIQKNIDKRMKGATPSGTNPYEYQKMLDYITNDEIKKAAKGLYRMGLGEKPR